jgi:hypothetical protein
MIKKSKPLALLLPFGTYLVCYLFGGQRAILDVMYALVQESGHIVWKDWWYALASRISL